MNLRLFIVLALALSVCTPKEDASTTDTEATTGTSVASTGTGMTTGATTGATTSTSTDPTTGMPATTATGECLPPPGEPLDVVLLAGPTLVVRPGSVTCGEPNPLSCDCISEAIDRLVVELPDPLAPMTYDFPANNPDTHRIECAMGDDGCSDTSVRGDVTIVSVSADCVTGTIDFGKAGSGSFAVAPCAP